MKKLILILILFSWLNYLEAQDSIQLPSGKYYSWVSLVNTEINIKGTLYEVRDTSVVLIHFPMMESNTPRKQMISNINYNMINIIQTRKKGSPLNGALYGFIGGGLAGGIFGYAAGKEAFFISPGFYTIAFGAVGGILGSGIGALAGLHRKQFTIYGDKRNFEATRAKLRKYSYLH